MHGGHDLQAAAEGVARTMTEPNPELEKGRAQARQDKRDAKPARQRREAAARYIDPLDDLLGPADGSTDG